MLNVDVTVIIVNWNGGQLLKECLNSVLQQTVKPKNIVVMDNGSTDGSIELIEVMPSVSVHRLNTNVGFAVANNKAIQDCDTEFIALLNPDALAEPNWLSNLVQAAMENPQISIFGSKQIMLRSPELLDGLGDCYHFSGLVKRYGYGQPIKNFESDSKLIFSACACAVLYRKEAFTKVGGFDEDYFCYIEDVDLGFRLRLAGYKALSVPSAVVHHAGSVSTGGNRSDFSIYYGHRNLVWTYIKNMPRILFWSLLPFHITLNVYSIIYFTLNGKGKIIWQAKMDAFKGIPKMWRKRIKIQSQRKISDLDIWAVLEKRLSFGRRKVLDNTSRKYFNQDYLFEGHQWPEEKVWLTDSYASVTVVIPCYRCSQTIRRAILSITAQTLKPAEVILVDDASTDETLKTLREIEIEYSGWVKVIENKINQGPGAARNKGWGASSQKFVAFLDSDDAWHPQKIEIQYNFMKKNPEVALSGHGSRLLKNDDSHLNWKLKAFDIRPIEQWNLLLSNRFVTPSIMVRTDITHRFDSQQRYMEDHRLWLEIVSEKLLAVKLNINLAAVYKPMYGVSGLSSNLWAMEYSELNNYQGLYQQKKISLWQRNFLFYFSLAKYIKRLLVVHIFRRFQLK